MAEKNYELIYKIRERKLSTDSLSNLETRMCNEAKVKAQELHKRTLDFLRKQHGVEHEISQYACMADGISHCTYMLNGEPKGVGRRACIFCGATDHPD